MNLETTGFVELDRRLGGGVSPSAIIGISGPPGSGKQCIAIGYALAYERCCCVSPVEEKPYMPPTQASRWVEATRENRLKMAPLDLLDEEAAGLCASFRALLAEGWNRFVILHAETLSYLTPPAELIRLVYLLRRSGAAAFFVADDATAGGLPTNPPNYPWETHSDVLFRTERPADGSRTRYRLTVPKPPSPEMEIPPLDFHIDESGPRAGARNGGTRENGSPAARGPHIRTSRTAAVHSVLPELFLLDKEQELLLRKRVDEINSTTDSATYRVSSSPYANTVEYYQNLERFCQGERVSDLYIIDVYRLRECVEKGVIQPLDGWVSEEWRQQFLPEAIQSCTYKGQLWAIPHWINAGVMIYRKDILAKHGLAVPRTYEDLIGTSQTALSRERRPMSEGFAFQGAVAEALSCAFLEFLWNHGGDIYTEDERPRILEAEGREALQLMHDLVHVHGISPPVTPSLTEADSYRLFWQDKVLFMRNWPSFLCRRPSRHRIASPDKIGMAPLPTKDGRRAPKAVLGGFAYVIPSQILDPEPLLNFHSKLYDERGIEQMAVAGWTCSPFRSVYTNPRVLATRPYYADLPDILSMGRSRQEITSYHRLTAILREEINLVLRKLRSPSEALEIIAGKLELHVIRQAETNRLQEVIDYLKGNLHLDLTREEVAARCKLNPSYFSSLFKEVTGETFRRYVNRERVRKAQRLLVSTEQSIGEVARAVGFSDPSYFSQVFREYTGLTPLQHRSQAQRRIGHH